MDVILVTASHTNEVHGTFNGKKTGCGINLLKPENATRFRRGAAMTDLGELSCEKCKAKIAKEMIRSDQKEMKVLLKEEKLRAKKGIEDEGIVPLGNTTARITSAPRNPAPVRPAPVRNSAPDPEPVQESQPAYIPEPAPGAPALDAELAKFAVNPHQQEEPVQETAPAPAPSPAPQDDFLAQFAVNKPQEETPAPAPVENNSEDDFLAQFAINNGTEPEPEAPAAPPVIDDISAALAAMQQNPAMTPQYAQPVEQPGVMGVENVSAAPAPEAVQGEATEWDLIANQLFGGAPAPEPAMAEPVVPPTAPTMAEPVQAAPVIDDISSALNALNTPLQAAPAPAPAPAYAEPAVQPTAPTMAEPVQEAPVIDDISSALNALNAPLQAAPAPAPAPAYAEPAVQPTAPTMAEPVQEAPVIDDIASALNAMNTPLQAAPAPAPEPTIAEPTVQPTAPTMAEPAKSAPVTDALFDAIDSFVQPVQPTEPVQPTPVNQPAAGMPGVGQVISVPQITGYDDKNQPEYTYIKMRIQSFDAKGQPVLVPLPGQNIPIPAAPESFGPASVLDKNIRLRDAMAAAMETPVSSRDMTPGQRIAAANAAKGDPVSANVSKIATNPHTKATSQAFINAISVSKEYSNQSLTDTNGLQQRTAVLGSVEDVLSQFGDNSLKEKKLAEQKIQEVAPVAVNEYKGPVRSYSTRAASKPSAPQSSPYPDRPLTKAEMKQMKKQEKIDAKFQKEMAKRGR